MFTEILTFALLGFADAQQRVKLKNVDVLTLYAGKMTTGRRSSPVPQLQCMGGSAGCSAFVPSVVQCYNRGTDGQDIQWECKADMEMKYKFGQIQVTCEGFDYPDDPYILAEYTIDRVGGSTSGSSFGETSFWSSSSEDSEEGSWALFIIIAFVLYLLVTSFNNANSDDRPPPYNPDFIPPAGTNPGTNNTGYFSGPGRGSSSSSSDGPGFGTGFAAGAATGFAAGTANANRRRNRGWFGGGNSWFGGNNWGTNNSYSQGFHDGRRSSPSPRRSSSPVATKTASGFGGTKRR